MKTYSVTSCVHFQLLTYLTINYWITPVMAMSSWHCLTSVSDCNHCFKQRCYLLVSAMIIWPRVKVNFPSFHSRWAATIIVKSWAESLSVRKNPSCWQDASIIYTLSELQHVEHVCAVRAGSAPSLGRSPGSGLCLWSLVTILLLAKHHTSKKCSKYVCGACSEASGLQKAGPWPSIYFIGALRLKRACCLFTREARLIWQKKKHLFNRLVL